MGSEGGLGQQAHRTHLERPESTGRPGPRGRVPPGWGESPEPPWRADGSALFPRRPPQVLSWEAECRRTSPPSEWR